MGEYIPTCEVADSTFHYKHGMAGINPKRMALTDEDIEKSETLALKGEIIDLRLENKDLSRHLDKALNESVNEEKIWRKQHEDWKRRHTDVMRTDEPLRYRLLNLKTFGLILLAIAVLAILARFLGFI